MPDDPRDRGAVPDGTAGLPAAPAEKEAAPAAKEVAPAGFDPRTRRLLNGPIVPTLLRLAFPNVGEAAARIAFVTFDAVYVGWLGTDALAGLGLVVPVFFLVQTATAGGLGVGVASAIARALGAGRREDADALVLHALLVAVGFGALVALAMHCGGPWVFALMGGRDGSLEAALAYAAVVFWGAPAIALANLLANAVRGTGHMTLPARTIIVGELFHLAGSPILILGFGPIPALGMTGAGLAALFPYLFATVVFVVHLRRGRGMVRLRAARPRTRLFAAILGVGLVASLNNLQAQLVGLVVTGLVGRFGPVALAAYSGALRLEILQIPIVFGFGSALVAMVGTAIGAGRPDRAKRVAWAGAAAGAAIGGAAGLVAVFAGAPWMSLFTADPAVIADGAAYLAIAGLGYPLFGAGMALYYAIQGAGRPLWVLVASLARATLTIGLGWVAVALWGWSFAALAAIVAAGLAVFGLVTLGAVALQRWR